jgi:uncharacterized protein YyaL (SSP411 family)
MNNSTLAALLTLDRSTLPADGGADFNRLIFARSPYLLQHAKNPVDWREWSDAAFAEARERDVPLLVSIGYSTCHWCHVMAAESFSDHEVAAVLNDSFVAIKVDREERPDLDDFYMTAARALTGGGGWPLNVFIDHDRRPFFAITYLPKQSRQQTPGFLNLLINLAALWQKQRTLVSSNAAGICSSLAELAAMPSTGGRAIDILAAEAEQQLAEIFDRNNGGFGSGAKFPMTTYLHFLLSRDPGVAPEAAAMALQTLIAMARGGINDQLAGGFHRYTVDRQWLIPHFEKMLYDQALLIITYVEAYRASGNRLLLETAVATARFVVGELQSAAGGFCAGLDADSEGEEGLFYTWSYEELVALLGADLPLLADYWGVKREGNLDGRSILHAVTPLEGFAAQRALTADEVATIIKRGSERLLAARRVREQPLRDPKVICSWNGLMISALVRLAGASEDAGWLQIAADTARFILRNMVTPTGRLLRNWLGTPAPTPAFAEDYAFFGLGLTDLARADPDPLWKENLSYFGGELRRLFIDAAGRVAFSGSDGEALPIEIPPLQDGVMPSTAGACATLLLRMGAIMEDESHTAVAAAILHNCRGVTEKSPAACLSLIMTEEELQRQPT